MNRLEIENNLRVALLENQFEVYYQPKVDVRKKSVLSLEALIRWKHPIKGWIPPSNFISLAEETGMIISIGDWIMLKTIEKIAEFEKLGMNIEISVNLSTKQFKHESLINNLKKLLIEYSINPKLLEIEITESSLIDNADLAIEISYQIHDLGVQIGIDDFGTGYSSLGYLKKFPVRTLKIDRSFIMDLEQDEDSQVIVKAVINLGHNLGLQVVAEGAETAEQCTILKDLNVDLIQGFYYSKPIPEKNLLEFFQTFKYS